MERIRSRSILGCQDSKALFKVFKITLIWKKSNRGLSGVQKLIPNPKVRDILVIYFHNRAVKFGLTGITSNFQWKVWGLFEFLQHYQAQIWIDARPVVPRDAAIDYGTRKA